MTKVSEMKHGLSAVTAIVLLTVCCIAVVPAVADDEIPLLPMQISGFAVDANGEPLPPGTVITATVDGITSEYTLVEAGKLSEPGTFGSKFLVTGKEEGSTITFAVNGVESEQTLQFNSDSDTGTSMPELPSLSFDVVIAELLASSDDSSAETPSEEIKNDEQNVRGKDSSDVKTDGEVSDKTIAGSSGSGDGNTGSSDKEDMPVSNPVSSESEISDNPDSSVTRPIISTTIPTSPNVSEHPTDQATTPFPVIGMVAGIFLIGLLIRRKI